MLLMTLVRCFTCPCHSNYGLTPRSLSSSILSEEHGNLIISHSTVPCSAERLLHTALYSRLTRRSQLALISFGSSLLLSLLRSTSSLVQTPHLQLTVNLPASGLPLVYAVFTGISNPVSLEPLTLALQFVRQFLSLRYTWNSALLPSVKLGALIIFWHEDSCLQSSSIIISGTGNSK